MSPFRHIVILSLGLICAAQALAQQLPVPPTLAAKSWLLLEMGSGQVLTAEKPDERIEPASLTKLMTAYLTFAALRQKTIALDSAGDGFAKGLEDRRLARCSSGSTRRCRSRT